VPNVRFEVDDLELEWTYRPNHFDFIHSRDIAQSVKDWPRYLGQMYKYVSLLSILPTIDSSSFPPPLANPGSHTKPGGYIELAEATMELNCDDGTYTGSALETYGNEFQRSMKIAGFVLPTGDMLKAFVKDAGFVDVEVHYNKLPWGSWPKDPNMKKIGQILEMVIATGFEVYPHRSRHPHLPTATDTVIETSIAKHC